MPPGDLPPEIKEIFDSAKDVIETITEEIEEHDVDERKVHSYLTFKLLNEEVNEIKKMEGRDVPEEVDIPYSFMFFHEDSEYFFVDSPGELDCYHGNIFDKGEEENSSVICDYTLVFRKPLNQRGFRQISHEGKKYSFAEDYAEDALLLCDGMERGRALIKTEGDGHFDPLLKHSQTVGIQDICLQNRRANCSLYEETQDTSVELHKLDQEHLTEFIMEEKSRGLGGLKGTLDEKVEKLKKLNDRVDRELLRYSQSLGTSSREMYY